MQEALAQRRRKLEEELTAVMEAEDILENLPDFSRMIEALRKANVPF